jgi:flavorubredoxin
MKKYDYDNSIAVTRDIHWVGFYDKEANLHCNPYIMIDEDEVLFFDPGSIPHFPTVMRKVIDLVNPKDISIIIASHQDPDICGNLAVVEDVIENPDLLIAAHSYSIRFIRYYGVHSNFYPVEEQDFKIALKSGRQLEFIFTPYLHSPGSIMTYDPESQSLFSSDIFGALDVNWELFAGDNFIEPMNDFHKIYMPGNQLLKHCMLKLEKMNIRRILPQHGSILEGKQVQTAIQQLKHLSCGFDLLGH